MGLISTKRLALSDSGAKHVSAVVNLSAFTPGRAQYKAMSSLPDNEQLVDINGHENQFHAQKVDCACGHA